MSEIQNSENNSPPNTTKSRRHYTPRKPKEPQVQIPNPAIQAMEMELVPFLGQRTEANLAVSKANAAVNRANEELQRARDYLAQIEGEVNYRLQTIAQLKGVPFQPQFQQTSSLAQSGSPYPPRFNDYPQASPPYQPIMPFPPGPPVPGVASFPASNRGLYPDAADRAESAIDLQTPELRAEFEGRRRQ